MTTTVLRSAAYGRHVGIRVNDSEIDVIRPLLPWWWLDELDGGVEHECDTTHAIDAKTVIRDLEFWVAEHAVGAVFIHAGVVEFEGKALILPGGPGSGKTTLVSSLVRAGFGYLSDRFAVLTDDGAVSPYPRPLTSLADDRHDAGGPAHDLGATTMRGRTPLGWIAFIKHDPGGHWNIRPISATAATLNLLGHAVAAKSETAGIIDTIASAAIAATYAWQGTRSDIDAKPLQELLTIPADPTLFGAR